MREVDEREGEEVKAKEKEEAARGRRTPYLPLPLLSPCPVLPSVASPPPLPPSPLVTLTTFLFARFSPASQGPPGIMPRSSLRMLNANSPPATPFSLPPPPTPPPPPPGPSSYSSSPSFSSEDRSPVEELRVRDCEAYSTQTRGSCLDPLASDSAGNYA